MTGDNSYPTELTRAAALVGSGPATRPLIEWLLAQCDVDGRSGTDFREGQRDIGRRLIDLLHAADPAIVVAITRDRMAAEVWRRARADA